MCWTSSLCTGRFAVVNQFYALSLIDSQIPSIGIFGHTEAPGLLWQTRLGNRGLFWFIRYYRSTVVTFWATNANRAEQTEAPRCGT